MVSKEHTEQAERSASRYIAQRETGPWTDQDTMELQRWLAESTLHRVVYYRLNTAWQEAGRLKALRAPDSRLSEPRPASQKQPRLRARAFAIAAGVLIATFGALIWYWSSSVRNTYTTAVGALQVIPLPDGSRITLNTDSKLRIVLSDHERRMELTRGEAFFEVAHDPSRPFIVQAGNRRVIAIGTQFSVRRDRDDVRVAVTEGTVAVTAGKGTQHGEAAGALQTGTLRPTEVLLVAGTEAHSEGSNMLIQKRRVPEVEQGLTWRTGVLTFHDTPLADAVAEFNRYNSRKIVIRDPAIAAMQVGGIFGATQPSQFVRLLEGAFPIRVIEKPDQITLMQR